MSGIRVSLLLAVGTWTCVSARSNKFAADEWVESTAKSFCTVTVSGQPSEPTLCTNRDDKTLVYTFFPHTGDNANLQRYFWISNFPTSPKAPQPLLVHVSGYGGDTGGKADDAADYYGFSYMTVSSPLKDGAGQFGLEFGNDGVANDENPTPCSEKDSRDIRYLDAIFKWIDKHPSQLDAKKVFFRGFSQNSMWSLYASVCFADRVAGLWQGGSGMVKVGYQPVTPGYQGQCKLSDYLKDDKECCKTSFCTDCKYWPLYPKTCAKQQPERKLVDCIMSYTNDNIACGSDAAVFEAHVHEGNDARLLSFEPATDAKGGHKDPENAWAWVAGCLGLSESCSAACETSFKACAGTAASVSKFATCEAKLKAGSLSGCTAGCSPTLGMLQTSEAPVVSLSEGRFGTSTGLQTTTTAPAPNCAKDGGKMLTTSDRKCPIPEGYTAPDFSVVPAGKCGSSGNSGTDNTPNPGSPPPVPPTTLPPSPAPPANGDGTCTADCEAEFKRCSRYHAKKGSPADTCSKELAGGTGRLGKVCEPGCSISDAALLEDEWQEW